MLVNAVIKWFCVNSNSTGDVFPVQAFAAFHDDTHKLKGFTIMPILLHPGSRIGSVTLNSSDPFEPLLIDPETLGHQDDVNYLMEGT